MIKVYGTHLCKDCQELKELYHTHQIAYEFYEFCDQIGNLKEFIRLRDENPIFEEAKKEGCLGIPCIILDDGTVTLNPMDAIHS